MLELRTRHPDELTAEPDLVAYCEGLSALAARCGIVDFVSYATTPSGYVLSHSNMTTMVAAEGAIRKKITEFKNQSQTKYTNEQRSEE